MSNEVSEATLKQRARSAAELELIANHKDEFDKLMREHHNILGVVWNPRLTDEQKAQRKIEELLGQYPNLRDRYADTGGEGGPR